MNSIHRYYLGVLGQLIEKMGSVQTANGSLLSQSLVMIGCGYGDGGRHMARSLPLILAGQANGRFKTDRFALVSEKKSSTLYAQRDMGDLNFTLLKKLGVPVTGWGVNPGTGPWNQIVPRI
jgi:hypothetical protein